MVILQVFNFSNNPHCTGNMLHALCIKVGAGVILTNNVDVPDSLTNGAMGTVTNIVMKKRIALKQSLQSLIT